MRTARRVWFFPLTLVGVTVLLGVLQISGSSIGIYHELFYGDSKDANLILNEPRPVRSDEWLVTTQLTLAQVANDFAPINDNIGNGIDVSLLVDAPTRDPVQFFKPHNWAFFALPAGIAFALKWWLLASLLATSVYFFVLTILPGKRLLAILLSLSFLASPFFIWWYQYITLAPVYYTLFGMVVAVKMMRSQNLKIGLLWSMLLAYLATSFVLVLYPPFQIPCILFALTFLVGYILDHRDELRKNIKQILITGGVTLLLATLSIVGCLLPKLSVIETVSNTAYPGNRIVESGGFNPLLFLASNTSLLTQSDSRAGAFSWIPNQSEGANFLLVFILLLPLALFYACKYRRALPNFWTVISLGLLASLFIVWLFIPGLDVLGRITALDRVLHARLLIGLGLINLLMVIVTVQILETKRIKISHPAILMYSGFILIAYLAIDLYIAKKFPGFMGERWAILLALPYSAITYLLLSRRFNFAAMALLVFSIGSVIFIHPLYRGVDILGELPLSATMRSLDSANSGKWVTDSLQLENLAVVNGKRSLSGVYVYPDLKTWEGSFSRSENSKYNRYAHVRFEFDRNPQEVIERNLYQPSPDQLVPIVEPCDLFLKHNNVEYILTTQAFEPSQTTCLTLMAETATPKVRTYFYRVNFDK